MEPTFWPKLPRPTKPLRLVGFDPSMSNWGICTATLYPNGVLTADKVQVVTPRKIASKTVRQNSSDLLLAQQLAAIAFDVCHGAHFVFAEVPVGSQSARAMASYGICVGILGALRSQGKQFIEVTPTEVKIAATGNHTATKKQMINWATDTHPEAGWPTHWNLGTKVVTESSAEHMADALGAIYAGIQTHQFLLAIQAGAN